MAPNRKKSKAPSAAAAAAARQKWKVGDLVLAKVKGFPAWPATVSEPEKWGYKSDSKKVLVFFFGTNQIAFCSHVDIEAFTEEKKQALQGKRYGKSADFVRAVQEITESFDKLKTRVQDDDLKLGVEVTVTNAENAAGSVNPGTSEMPSGHEPSIPQLNGSISTMEIPEACLPFEDAASVKDENRYSPNLTRVSVTPLESSHVLQEKPFSTNSLSNVKHRRLPSTRRSRTSRIDARSIPQGIELPSEDSVAGRENMLASALCNVSPRQTHRKISHLVQNCNAEDSKSGIASRECNSLNMSEDSSFDSTCIPEHIETGGNSNENVELTKKRGLEIKAVFVKKKRKPNRKRISTDSQELAVTGDKVADLVGGVHEYRLNSPNACEKSNESPSKVDGDEYLPLVKRARVRMGKLSDLEGHGDVLMHGVDEKSTNGCSIVLSNGLSMSSLNKISSKDQDPIVIKESADGSVALVDCTVSAKEDEPNNFCMDVSFDRVVGKVGVPPSKRLLQSLKGTALGAPKESQHCTQEQLPKPSFVTVSSISSFTEATDPISRNDVGEDASATNVDAACDNDMEVDLSSNAAIVHSPCIQESKLHSIKSTETKQCRNSSQTVEEQESAINIAEHDASDVNCLSLDIEDRKDISANNSSHQSFQYNVKQSSDSSQGIAEPPDHKISSSDSTEISKYVVRKDDNDASKITHNIEPYMHGENEVHSENFLLPLSKKMPVHSISVVDGEINFHSSLKSGTSTEVADTNFDPSHRVCDSNECSGEKVVLRIQTSPSSVSGSIQASLLASSLNLSNSTPNGSHPQNNDFVYPTDKLLVKREEGTSDAVTGQYGTSESYGKVTNYVEAKASLTSFGNALGTLTRTKDSIGRATRMAIECAKAGLAVKVVDILSRTLENESSLNRKVDLFFLVDSMMQCSRGLKGEVGGLYPSAIQATLPRLLSAAAPVGDAANENRRQCLKVLKLWLERRILPDSVIRHHMQSLDSFPSGSYSSGPFSRRSSRTERAIHDPVREMDGMLVDEYGSNSTFQLSGFCMPRMRKDDSDGSDSDCENFEAVTPEHNSETPEPERPNSGRHRHILEDVDGELEMEDVAPSEAEMNLSNSSGGISIQTSNSEVNIMSFRAPPLPNDVPPSSPPLPTSPPPPVPHRNHSHPAHLIHPPSNHSMPAPHSVCPPHGRSLSLAIDHPLQQHPNMHPLPPSAGCPPPMYLSVPVHPSTDMLAKGPDSMLYGNRNSSADSLPPVSPRTQPRQMVVQDPSTNCSFDSFSGPRLAAHPANGHSVRPPNGFRHSDGPSYENQGFNPRPPPLGPPNNFSSVQGDHRGHHPWREGPPRSYSSNYHRGPSRDDRNYYNDHNWRKPGAQERYEERRYHGPPFPGDKGGGPYHLHPYDGPANDHNRGGQGWGYPPREMHHRNSMPVRPSSSEDPRYWRQ